MLLPLVEFPRRDSQISDLTELHSCNLQLIRPQTPLGPPKDAPLPTVPVPLLTLLFFDFAFAAVSIFTAVIIGRFVIIIGLHA